MPLKLYNTLTRAIEEFKPIDPPNVGMYSCGPTVYGETHLGHARSYTFVDTLKRVLIYNDYQVKHVMNLTDVGHMTEYDVEEQIKKSGQGKRTVWEITEYYSQLFFKMLEDLNIVKPEIIVKASDHIKEQIELIRRLQGKGFTYQIDDGVYFDISKFPSYGKLARLKLDGQEAGARVDVNPQKKSPYDFALWKFTKPEDKKVMEWDSPWGRGVPGWHIECSAMSMKYLGETFDIHTGGEDLIPIHHTNEIAQSEAATGKTIANYFIHNAHLIVEGEKMSRSKGNFYTLEDIKKKGFEALALRYLFLTAQYRTQMNFTWRGLEASAEALKKLKELMSGWKKEHDRAIVDHQSLEKMEVYKEKFQNAINDDLNMPMTLSVVWEAAKSNIPSLDKYDLVSGFDEVLGLELVKVSSLDSARDKQVPKGVQDLVEEREQLRSEKKWDEADEIRKKIEELGWVVEDTEEGSKVKRK